MRQHYIVRQMDAKITIDGTFEQKGCSSTCKKWPEISITHNLERELG